MRPPNARDLIFHFSFIVLNCDLKGYKARLPCDSFLSQSKLSKTLLAVDNYSTLDTYLSIDIKPLIYQPKLALN